MKHLTTCKAPLLFLLLAILEGCDISSNTPSPVQNYFVKFYGDDGFQQGIDMVVNPDGTFILFGNSGKILNDPQARLFLVKADVLGNVIWQRTFGSPGGSQARDIELTSDGGIVVVANTFYRSTTTHDIMLARFSQDGTSRDSTYVLPFDYLGAQPIVDSDAKSVTELSDGGFIIAGSSKDLAANPGGKHAFDGIVLRLNSSLAQYSNNDWKTVLGAGPSGVAVKVYQISPNLFYRFGYTDVTYTSIDNYDYQVIGLSNSGEPVSTVTFGQTQSDEELGSVTLISSVATGIRFYLAGISTYKDQTSDSIYGASMFLSFSASDTSLSPVIYTTVGGNLATPNSNQASITSSIDQGLYILTSVATSGNSNLQLTKVTEQFGNYIIGKWATPLIYGGVGDDFAGSVRELPDGKIIIMGTMTVGGVGGETKMVLIKVNKDGQFAN
jgi:hypothetical protein